MTPILQVKTSNGSQYNVPRASAVNQKELLLIVGGPLNAISRKHPTALENTDTMIGLLMSFDDAKFDRVANLVTQGMVQNGTQTAIDISYFQNNILAYFQVIAQLITGNLHDFFTWLTADPKGESKTPTK